MAPSGRERPRRVGLGRMDAALDAMRFMGFPGDLVRKTVKDLLKAYGGDEGWFFIEEASYKVLIDTILEAQEHCETEKPKEEQYSLEDKMQQEENGNVHSAQVHPPISLPKLPMEIIACTKKNSTPGEELGIGVHSSQVESEQVLHQRSRSPPPLEISTCFTDTSQDKLGMQAHSPEPLARLPRQRRKPCYGWISSDDEEDILTLTPAA